jgi:hypothetical protein
MNSRVCYALQMIPKSGLTVTERHAIEIQVELIQDRISSNEAIASDFDHLEFVISYLIPIYEKKQEQSEPIDLLRDADLETKVIAHAFDNNDIEFPYQASDVPAEILEKSKKALGVENVSFLPRVENYDEFSEQGSLF